MGTKVCRYNWHSADSLGWPFPILKYRYIFRIKYTKQFYRTAHGNCYGLKLAKCRLQFKKNKYIVSFIIIFGTISFRIQSCVDDMHRQRTCSAEPAAESSVVRSSRHIAVSRPSSAQCHACIRRQHTNTPVLK